MHQRCTSAGVCGQPPVSITITCLSGCFTRGTALAVLVRQFNAFRFFRTVMPVQSGEALRQLAVSLMETGRYVEAEVCAVQAVASDPANAQFHSTLATTRHLQKRWAEAC